MDGARAHTKGKNKKTDNKETCWDRLQRAAAFPNDGEPVIELVVQPANSPCTNKCDLGFFASLDTLLPAMRGYKPDKIVSEVEQGFSDYPPAAITKLDQTWDLVLVTVYTACTAYRYSAYTAYLSIFYLIAKDFF